jgi:hypothetical protein
VIEEDRMMQYFVKPIYAGVTMFLGSLLAALQAGEGTDIGDLGTTAWLTIAIAVVFAVGGVLGLQAAPADISTSVRS